MFVVVLTLFIAGVVWISVNSLFMPKLKCGPHSLPLVSICVPLRNVEDRVETLISNLKQLQYEKLEILLYDDDSVDQTADRVNSAITHNARFQLLKGDALSEERKGKPHACFQLACAAKGKLIIFIDANVELDVRTIDACVATMERGKFDALSGFPKFVTTSFFEKLLMPLLHFFVYMHLPIALANKQSMPQASAASGAFLCIKRESYFALGGHELVKEADVEDVTLFRELKKNGYKALIVHVADFVRCEMYGSSKATWNGFSKNCFAGLGHSYVLGTGVLLVYLAYYTSPAVLALYGVLLLKPIYFIPYICITLQRVVSDVQSRQLNGFTYMMPLSAACYCALLVNAMWKRLRKREDEWKGRAV